MQSFKDTGGRTWTVSVNVDSIRRVRALLTVDLLDVLGGKLVEKLIGDPILLVDVIYAICKPEADTLGITDEDFGRAMAGDAIDLATKVLLDEIVNFSPSPRDRANLKSVLATSYRLMDRARDLVEEKINSGTIEKAAESALVNAMSTFGEPPESSE